MSGGSGFLKQVEKSRLFNPCHLMHTLDSLLSPAHDVASGAFLVVWNVLSIRGCLFLRLFTPQTNIVLPYPLLYLYV